jgi:carbamoyltransferase
VLAIGGAGLPGPARVQFYFEHHLSHAASAFYPSPYEDAVVLTMYSVGEWATTSAAIGSGKDLEVF